ncbi:MAG: ABC transporter permease [Oscillospiraceae bacterium]|jgi:ABC-type dipeptide/oligopeptide/nickel transport system permease subunit|nr:ABC transporter permease [Oscillospiraceae bacterium]
MEETKNVGQAGEFEVLEEALLPPVNEFKRFIRVFFRRKVVIIGFALVVLVIFVAIFADLISPYDPYEQDLHNVMAAPNGAHLLGTDALGRDLLSRIMYGTRIALIVGVLTVLISAVIGVAIGLVAGFAQSKVQTVIMRLTDALIAIPSLILQLLLANLLKSFIGGMGSVVVALGLTMFPGYIRMVNAQVLTLKQNDYVLAGRAMGDKKRRIVLRHILPNAVSPLIVMMTMMMGASIMAEAGLSFLGLGIAPPAAAWGQMCREGYQYLMTRPLLSIAPGFAIMILVFSYNMVGDGLRDALDPRLRGSLD